MSNTKRHHRSPGYPCPRGHTHPEPLGSTALLVVRKRKQTDGDDLEILVRWKYDYRNDYAPSWLALPSAERECGEAPARCALRAANSEMGLPADAFHFRLTDVVPAKHGLPQVTVLLAQPARKMGTHVGHLRGYTYTFMLVSEIAEIEVARGVRIDCRRLRELVGAAAAVPKVKKGLFRRAFAF